MFLHNGYEEYPSAKLKPESVVIKAETSPVICLASNIRLTVRIFCLPRVFPGAAHCLLASKVGAGGTA
jgi:hypothetical protein